MIIINKMSISSDEDALVRKYVLVNATQHEGVAQAKSVLGRLLGDHPELREKALDLRYRVERAVEEVNRLSLAKQQQELERLGGYVETAKRVEKKGLPDLERKDRFVVRFAPNPDGALHLGNARPAILNDEYARRYKGKFILRFDDTDPKIKIPEKVFYKWIRDDLKWLKIRIHKEAIASKRLPIYYKYAERLVKMGAAYVCTCDVNEWKKLRSSSRACKCRQLDIKTHTRRWRSMLSHKYKEGEAVLRIKTDLEAKNPAVRDWAAMRIVDKPNHPLSNKKVWPLYNFASAIDDKLLEITHIFRGQEHSTNEVKQRYLFDYFKWEYPLVITLGRFSLAGMVLSKSQIREGIEKRMYRGWDDLRLGTLRALKRRGFQPEALREIIVEIGPKPSDITISQENLAAYNRKIIDKTANRYFFIPNPKKIIVKNIKIKSAKLPLHPEVKRGWRLFKTGNVFYIDQEDFINYKGQEVRLKELCNIKLGEASEYAGQELKPVPKIQWVPEKHIPVHVNFPEREIKGYGESNLLKAKVGDVVQFERFGFVRLEKITKKLVVAVWCHE